MKTFNINADCSPELHYMVNLDNRLLAIKQMVDKGQYFTINRARQYGKTTILQALEKFLQADYTVLSLDFQIFSSTDFEEEHTFVEAFSNELLDALSQLDPEDTLWANTEQQLAPFASGADPRQQLAQFSNGADPRQQLAQFSNGADPRQQLAQFSNGADPRQQLAQFSNGADPRQQLAQFASGIPDRPRLSQLFRCLSRWCANSDKKIVLMIDEVDSASNNQVFLDFLAQLRGYYIQRKKKATFHSVILSGVYDIRNIKHKITPDGTLQQNSPWNIAADFRIELGFSREDIAGMLQEYEQDYQTGMDVAEIARLLHAYTSGYPYLVSKLCKLLDEQISGSPEYPDRSHAWTKNGVLEAVKLLLSEKNMLFESLIGKLQDYPQLHAILHSLLFQGQSITYNPDDSILDMALMFGFLKIEHGMAVISNRIFETRLYNYFLTAAELHGHDLYKAALQDKNQFICNGHLNMKRILEKFVLHFNELYGDQTERFYEEDGRKYFLLYLKPIINGVGNYYIESRTRNMERTDIIIDYHGEQYIVELKIWRGNAYHTRGEQQLAAYLEHYHLQKGYMLSFNFNQKKHIGVTEIQLGSYTLIEAVI